MYLMKFTDVASPITFRGCFLNGHYSCRHIEGVLTSAGAQLEQCDQCKHKVYCNSGNQIKMSMLGILAAYVSFFNAF